jgi:hypothetical protein
MRRAPSRTEFTYSTIRFAQSSAANQADNPAESGSFGQDRYAGPIGAAVWVARRHFRGITAGGMPG